MSAKGNGLTALNGDSTSPRQTVANSSRTARKPTGAISQNPSPRSSTKGVVPDSHVSTIRAPTWSSSPSSSSSAPLRRAGGSVSMSAAACRLAALTRNDGVRGGGACSTSAATASGFCSARATYSW